MKKNYALLDENLRKYHQYYHQQEEELLLQSRNIIAEFTKKYQAMIKENYIIEKLETYLSLVKPYFIINRNQTRITNKAKENGWSLDYYTWTRIKSFMENNERKWWIF